MEQQQLKWKQTSLSYKHFVAESHGAITHLPLLASLSTGRKKERKKNTHSCRHHHLIKAKIRSQRVRCALPEMVST
jgi:hypothetical protein